MEKSLQSILVGIESKLKDIKAPILDRLKPGITEQTVRDVFSGLDLPEQIIELYAWRNGTTVDGTEKLGETWLLPMGCFMSANRVMAVYKREAGVYDDWSLGKLPLFESRGGEYFLIDIDRQSDTRGMVFFHSSGAVDHDIIITKYDSLETMLRSIEICFERRAYFWGNGLLKADFLLEREINMANNPESKYWKLFN